MVKNGWTEKVEELEKENTELKKYKQMWEESKKDIARASVENWKVSAKRFLLEMGKLEQKYFPKEENLK